MGHGAERFQRFGAQVIRGPVCLRLDARTTPLAMATVLIGSKRDTGVGMVASVVGSRTCLQATRANGSCRGVFVPRKFTAFKDIQDGLSNTIACGEIATDLGDRDVRTTPHLFTGWGPVGVHTNPRVCQPDRDPNRPRFWSPGFTNIGAAENRRGYSWANGGPLYSGFNTTLPPNNEVCLGADHSSGGHAPASSRHPGGVHVLMADGAVKFVSESIEAGDDTAPVGLAVASIEVAERAE